MKPLPCIGAWIHLDKPVGGGREGGGRLHNSLLNKYTNTHTLQIDIAKYILTSQIIFQSFCDRYSILKLVTMCWEIKPFDHIFTKWA